jgi:transcriptional regulator with XRE-family HTH domain
MSITPEVSAKTLTQLVATEIRVQMARADVRQSQLARELGKNEQWLSVRLRGRQPIDVNDLSLIARALGVGVHELLPPPAVADLAGPAGTMGSYVVPSSRMNESSPRPRDNRPTGHPGAPSGGSPRRTSYLSRGDRRKRD